MQTAFANQTSTRNRTLVQILVAVAAIGMLYVGRLFTPLFDGAGFSALSTRLATGVIGQWLMAGTVFLYLARTGRSPLSLAKGEPLRWYHYTLIPVGLYVAATVFFMVGSSVGWVLFQEANQAASISPATGLEFVLAAMLAVSAGICEELVLRAFFLDTLAERMPRWIASVAVVLVFGALHIPGWGLTASMAITFWAMPITLYVARSRRLVPAIIAHALNDLIVFLILSPMMSKMAAQ
jgi:membrane protease YdiL (CAAX protease family)